MVRTTLAVTSTNGLGSQATKKRNARRRVWKRRRGRRRVSSRDAATVIIASF